MPLVGAPTFAPGILTADQLNSLVTLLEQKFDGGIGTDDISWPLSAGGNIDMVQHDILHLYKLWNVRNLAERDSATTVQDVFDEVAGEGGGVILLPANSTETLGTGGVEVGPNTLVMGQGRTSIFATSGTLTNHMFHNAANGDSGIKFVNLKATNAGASGGAFDIFGFTQVEACQLIDVYMVVARENGVSFDTSSPGSANTNNAVLRGQIDLDGGDVGVFATDVVSLRVAGVDFNLLSGDASAVKYAASGNDSNGEKINILNNDVTVDDSVTGGVVFSITAGSTLGTLKVNISQNDVKCGAGALSGVIDLAGAGGAGPHIYQNNINGTLADFAVRVQNTVGGLMVDDNDIYTTGTNIGVLIGGSARSGSVSACKNFLCTNNRVKAKSSAFVFVHPGSGNHFETSVIAGNVGISGTSGEAEFEIWNLGSATTTTYSFHLVIGDNAADTTTSTYGWKNYSNMGSTQGGSAGIANNSYLTVTNNLIPGTDFADSGGDFASTQDNNTPVFYAHGQNIV